MKFRPGTALAAVLTLSLASACSPKTESPPAPAEAAPPAAAAPAPTPAAEPAASAGDAAPAPARDEGDKYKDCKIIAKQGGLQATSYKFDATDPAGKVTRICVKGQTKNENAAIIACKAGEYDSMNDCTKWP